MAENELERRFILLRVQIAIVSFCQCRAEFRECAEKAAGPEVKALVCDKSHEVIRPGAHRSDLQNGPEAD